MQELHNKKLLEKSKILFSNILELKKLDINNNFCSELLEYIINRINCQYCLW